MVKYVEDELDVILKILGNRVRREILRLLAEEPMYLPQLAKEIGVSQQAILKHLDKLMEQGIISSYYVKSDLAAPPRKYYKLNKSFFLTVSVAQSLVNMNLRRFSELKKRLFPKDELMNKVNKLLYDTNPSLLLKSAGEVLNEIDEKINRLENSLTFYLELKRRIMDKMRTVINEKIHDGLKRKVAYLTFCSWSKGNFEDIVSELAEELDIREKKISKIIKEIQECFQLLD